MSVKKETQTEAVPVYQGLGNSTQTFHAIASFEVVNGTVVMRSPDELKQLNPHKYRDVIFTLDRAIDRYISMGQQLVTMRNYGTRGVDELFDILDDFAAKIIEAIGQCEHDNKPVSLKALNFRKDYEKWRAFKTAGLLTF